LTGMSKVWLPKSSFTQEHFDFPWFSVALGQCGLRPTLVAFMLPISR
jgi:hypothetical protein